MTMVAEVTTHITPHYKNALIALPFIAHVWEAGGKLQVKKIVKNKKFGQHK